MSATTEAQVDDEVRHALAHYSPLIRKAHIHYTVGLLKGDRKGTIAALHNERKEIGRLQNRLAHIDPDNLSKSRRLAAASARQFGLGITYLQLGYQATDLRNARRYFQRATQALAEASRQGHHARDRLGGHAGEPEYSAIS